MQRGQGRGQGIILDRMAVMAALKGWRSSRGLSRQRGDGGRGPGEAQQPGDHCCVTSPG